MTTTHIVPTAIDSTAMLNGPAAAAAISRAIEGSHGLGVIDISDAHATFFEWDEDSPSLLLTPPEVRTIARNNDATLSAFTVVVTLDKDAVRSAIAASAIDPDIDEHDLAHNAVFYFGIPTNSTFEIIGVTGTDFIVKYTTDILDAIQQLD